MIKFNKYCVVNTKTGAKARVFYSLDDRVDGRPCVTLCAKDYQGQLGAVFADEFKNETDSTTDYFESGRVDLFQPHPLYAAARAFVEGLA